MTLEEAGKRYPGTPIEDEYHQSLDSDWSDDPRWVRVLVDTKGPSLVWVDGSEPEDLTIDRDLYIFVTTLNRVANGG